MELSQLDKYPPRNQFKLYNILTQSFEHILDSWGVGAQSLMILGVKRK